ncbi:hypothetical protein PUNSTDRAFT_137821 [Punctularia strigosozonata HHB-11173 SS5]|uniref:Fungal-type protein kinase domain-containing protein n=1 Tax=Punctularia strigosozonata (strain HHB-11173) TaxID=741275 RepID=R7S5A8_PUNST|nr:uncharacterized protein PUNSTDRAFT_137821 [Punctularia strigosozonata HHB-11173 SS5]EIN05139.1 hypothetical protein PUNSTDRAFT_137821 [Punctularia strigosozonata HHB-11173 SS5]
MYALKRMWRDESLDLEADLRSSNLPDGSPVLHIEGSRDAYPRDETLNVIRRGITAKPKDSEPGQDDNRKKKKKLANDVNVDDQNVSIFPWTYTLMTTRGLVLKCFNNAPLLVSAMRDAIEGHRDLWFRGVLHRDISPGNIIITPVKSGCLVDLDHGKGFKKMIDCPAPRNDITQKIPDYITTVPGPEHSSWPDTDDGSEDCLMRTGTKSVMSGELISPARAPYHPGFNRYVVVQGVIHDIESFFWVLVYLCLTRTGKGQWRDELLKDPPEDDVAKKILHNIVYCLYDSSEEAVLKDNKAALFLMPDHMENHIVKAFHPDLICLQPLVLSWWKLLVFSYRTYNDLTPGVIHAQVLKLFDEELKGIKQQFEAQTLDAARSSAESQPASASEGRVGDGSRTTAPEFNISPPRPKARRTSRRYNGDPPPDPFDVVSDPNTRSNTGSHTPAPKRARLEDN